MALIQNSQELIDAQNEALTAFKKLSDQKHRYGAEIIGCLLAKAGGSVNVSAEIANTVSISDVAASVVQEPDGSCTIQLVEADEALAQEDAESDAEFEGSDE